MKRLFILFITFTLVFLPGMVLAGESPLKFPMREGSNASAHQHNEEGIDQYNQGHYDVALKHFQTASKIDPSVGEAHFNEALSLDKLGRHQEATKHFYAARKYAHGNPRIMDSGILNSHAPMKMEGS